MSWALPPQARPHARLGPDLGSSVGPTRVGPSVAVHHADAVAYRHTAKGRWDASVRKSCARCACCLKGWPGAGGAIRISPGLRHGSTSSFSGAHSRYRGLRPGAARGFAGRSLLTAQRWHSLGPIGTLRPLDRPSVDWTPDNATAGRADQRRLAAVAR